MKTPKEIAEHAARELLAEHGVQNKFVGNEAAINSLAWELVGDNSSLVVEHALAELVRRAIDTDRKQRDLYELIAEALDERTEDSECIDAQKDAARQRRTAEALRNQEGETARDDFIGPMLDDMEKRYGA